MPDKIFLAHGLFGFGNLLASLPSVVNYFNGVAAHLRSQGHTVIEPQVNPIGSIQQRGDQLASAILAQTNATDRVHIIAHSMGGLDARYAISFRQDIVQRIATLVTIGTPHRGSPVADAVANPTDPLFAHIPTFIVTQLEANAGALHDLTTNACSQFDSNTKDVGTVRYIEVAGDASKGSHELFLFHLAAVIGRINRESNDGVVTRSSALRDGHQHLDDWPVDHAGEIGWSFDSPVPVGLPVPFLQPPPHLARYDAIVALL